MKTVQAGTAFLALFLLWGCSGGEKPGGQQPHAETIAPAASGKDLREGQVPEDVPYRLAEEWTGLEAPWDMAIAKDGTIYFTERGGSVRVIRSGKLEEKPVYTMERPFRSQGEGGLLGLALDPEFERNGYLYVYHTYEEKGTVANRVVRLAEESGSFKEDRVLIGGIPGDTNHNGGRIRFGPDGYLYITAGDRYEPALAQDRSSTGGKLLRITRDGAVPKENPFPGSPVYSLGHRNPQGLAWNPETGVLYASEHGQSAGDELNRIEAGANYGWPVIRKDQTSADGSLRLPLAHSGEDTWAPSGLAYLAAGPWKGRLAAAGLRGQAIILFTLNGTGDRVQEVRLAAKGYWGRLRSVQEGPDGSLYVLTNNRDGRGTPKPGDDRILRLVPR